MDALPETPRRVLIPRFVFDLTPIQIADVLGSSVDAGRHVQHRALKSLAGAIAQPARRSSAATSPPPPVDDRGDR